MNVYLRTRRAHPARLAEAAAHAVEVANLATEISGVEVEAWTARHGRPLGSTTWTWRAPSLAEGADLQAKLDDDPDYVAKVAAGHGLFVGPVDDAVGLVAAAAGEAVPSRFTTTTTARCRPGRRAEALRWAAQALVLTGRGGLVLRSRFGPVGEISWVAPADSLDQVEAAADALGEALDREGPRFLAGPAEAVLAERLG